MPIKKETIDEVTKRLFEKYGDKPRPLQGIFGRSAWRAIAEYQTDPEVKRAMLDWNKFPVFVDEKGNWSEFQG